MGSYKITGLSQDNFQEKIKNSRITLLYPWISYRNAFLSYIVEDSGRDLIYYRLVEDDTTLETWLPNMIDELGDTLGNFANTLTSKLDENDPTAWGDALAQDINNATRGQDIWFFLDEVDRLPHDNRLQTFMLALVDTMADNINLVVSSRLLKYQPWYDFVADGHAAVLGTERRANDVMFTIMDEPRPPLEVYALGRGYALVNGQEITNWDGALPRNLFFYFMDNPLVTRDQIFEVFWPRLNTKEATNVFHVTKRKISERITANVEMEGSYELTQYSTGFYKPSDKVTRYYDVHEFEEAVSESMVAIEEDEEEMLLRRAIDLYKGPFLQDGTMGWMAERRTELRGLYAQALIGMGRISNRQGDKMMSLGYFVRALKETPEREDIHRDVMSLYIERGMLDDARNQYQMLTEILDEQLGIGPSKETRDLFEKSES
jgi:DNA-binding SARP family transcriptional activator